MLNTLPRHSSENIDTVDEVPPRDLVNIDLRSVVRFLRRNLWLIAFTAVVCAILAVGYIKLTPKLYTASAQVLIDTRKMDLFRAQAVIEDPAINTAEIESQMQILRSDEIARKVVADGDLKLLKTEEFGGQPLTFARRVLLSVSTLWGLASAKQSAEVRPPTETGWFHKAVASRLPAWLNPFPPDPRAISETTQLAVQKFQRQLSVTRIGLSYVIQIQFVSQDPALSAAVANKVASTYIAEQLRSKLEMAAHAGKWLEGRIVELRDQATNSDRAVQTFKAEHNIINAGDQLMTDQQVQELSKQRILAEANVAEAKARYDRIREVNTSPSKAGAAVTDALDNALIVRLQERYLDLVRQQSDLAARYGSAHRTVAALGREIDQNRQDTQTELRRLEETYKSEYEIALTRLEQLQVGLDKLIGTSGKALQTQVDLRELESTSNSYNSLYNSFLERYIETVQQLTFPVTEAKVITPAAKPFKGDGPGSLVILGSALAFGGLLGCGLALGREMLDSVVRTPDQLERLSGADFLGVLPIVKRGEVKAAEDGSDPAVASPFASMPLRMKHVLDQPLSLYAETIRSIKVAADLSRGGHQVIGTISALPGEGKSTVATNMAFLMASASGARTLLVDLDLRNPSRGRDLDRNRGGVVQLLAGRTTLKETVCVDAPTGLHFLPSGAHRPISNTSEILKSQAMQQMLDQVRQHYDYVVLDLPPLAPLVDVRAMAQFVDGFLLVTEFGKTSSDVLRRVLRSAPDVKQKLVGAVLNKVDLNALRRLEDVPDTYYTSDHYVEVVRRPRA